MKQIQSDIKLVWDEVIRLSNQPQTIISPAIGNTATTIKGASPSE